MKHKFTLETTVEDSAGNEFEVTAEVKAETSCEREDEGIYIDDMDISNVILKCGEEAIKLKYAEDMPDKFNQDQVRHIYDKAEDAVQEDVKCRSDYRHEYSNDE